MTAGPYHGNRLIDVSNKAAELLEFKGNGVARVRVEYVGRAPLEGSDDRQLIATLRTGAPAPSPSLVRVASARPFVPEMPSSGRAIRGEVPMPEGRPYSLGNTPGDQASINATSEMSAPPAAVRPDGSSIIRARCPTRMIRATRRTSVQPTPMRRSIRAARAKSSPAAGSTEARLSCVCFEKSDQGGVDLAGAFLLHQWPAPSMISFRCSFGSTRSSSWDALGADQAGDDGIVRSGDEHRGLMDLRAVPGRGQLPIAVDVAVPVETAAETRLPVGPR